MPASQANERAVAKSDSDVRSRTGRDRLHRRTKPAVKAIENQQHADAGADISGTGPGQAPDAGRHAGRGAGNKRPQPAPVQRLAKLPDRVALHDQAERDDQRCCLQGCQDVEPDRGRDQPECKTRERATSAPKKVAIKKCPEIEWESIHVLDPCKGERA
jgi:hypothetical protein